MKQMTTTAAEQLAEVAVKGLEDKKGLEIVRLDLRDVEGAISDFFVICSGTSDKHVQALSRSVEDMLRKEENDKPINIEGYSAGEWVLLDYVNVVVHIFQRDRRDFFDIEGLWGDAEVKKYEEIH